MIKRNKMLSSVCGTSFKEAKYNKKTVLKLFFYINVGFSPKERNYTEIERGAVIPNTSANMIL
jgi:hypothetical protein